MQSRHRNSSAESIPRGVALALPIIFFGLGGLIFCSLSGVYGWQVLHTLRRNEFEFAIGSSWGTDWHRSFSVADHPILFAFRVLLDVTGAIGAFGVGVILFGVLVVTCVDKPGPMIKRIGAVAKPWAISSFTIFGAHFVFMLVPYLLALIS